MPLRLYCLLSLGICLGSEAASEEVEHKVQVRLHGTELLFDALRSCSQGSREGAGSCSVVGMISSLKVPSLRPKNLIGRDFKNFVGKNISRRADLGAKKLESMQFCLLSMSFLRLSLYAWTWKSLAPKLTYLLKIYLSLGAGTVV